jgi:hypothetical protein
VAAGQENRRVWPLRAPRPVGDRAPVVLGHGATIEALSATYIVIYVSLYGCFALCASSESSPAAISVSVASCFVCTSLSAGLQRRGLESKSSCPNPNPHPNPSRNRRVLPRKQCSVMYTCMYIQLLKHSAKGVENMIYVMPFTPLCRMPKHEVLAASVARRARLLSTFASRMHSAYMVSADILNPSTGTQKRADLSRLSVAVTIYMVSGLIQRLAAFEGRP